MTTFNTVEELMQVLDANPHLLESLRSRLLTRELLELPEIVARLAGRVDQITEQLGQLTEQVNQLTERVNQLTDRVNQLTDRVDQIAEQLGQLTEQVNQLTDRVNQLTDRVDQIAEQLGQLTERVNQLTERVNQLTERVNQLTDRVDQLTERVDQIAEQLGQLTERVDQLAREQERTNHRLDQIVDDLGQLKNVGTITATREQAEVIAEFVGLHYQKQLPRSEIIALSRNQDTTQIRSGDLISFQRADLVMEATDDDGAVHYIAVEASFTADERDTGRAIRNAGYLTWFTGRPALAVVSAMRIDQRIQRVLDTDQVVWYRLEDDDSG